MEHGGYYSGNEQKKAGNHVVIKVGICNMDRQQAVHMENMLSDILSQYDRWEIEQYTKDTLIEALKEKTFSCSLLVLDVFEPEEEVDIPSYLEQAGLKTDIIYITESQNRVMKCYQDRAYAYILKPLHDSDMRREISRYFKESNIQQRCLRITFNGTESYIPLDSIQYIESAHRKVFIYTADSQYEFYSRLDDLEGEVAGGNFIRCPQTYRIAVPYITDFTNETVVVAGKYIPVSRKYRALVQSVLYQAELAATSTTDNFVHAGVHQLTKTKGSLICVKGEYLGKIVRLVPEQTVMVGRSSETADVVVNLPQVSRQHCKITYHEQEDYYEVQDCSTNGTVLNGQELLRRGDVYAVKPGTSIVFGDDRYVYRLG